jgi:hypothetical protein
MFMLYNYKILLLQCLMKKTLVEFTLVYVIVSLMINFKVKQAGQNYRRNKQDTLKLGVSCWFLINVIVTSMHCQMCCEIYFI